MERVFLDKNHLIILEIVKELYKEHDQELSYIEISRRLGIDRRVIIKHIEELLRYDSANAESHFSFENSILRYSTMIHPSILVHEMLKETVKFKLVEKLFKVKSINCTNFCFEQGISRSVFQKHVSHLRHLLKEYDINLNFSAKENLQGPEHQIRFFFHSLFSGLKTNEIIETNPAIISFTKEILKIEPRIDYCSISNIQISLFIHQVRTQRKCFIPYNKDFCVRDHPTISFHDFFERISKTETFIRLPSAEIIRAECRYFYFLFCSIIMMPFKKTAIADKSSSSYKSPQSKSFINVCTKELPFSLTQKEICFLETNLYYVHKFAKRFKGGHRLFGIHDINISLREATPKDYYMTMETIDKICKQNHEIQLMMNNYISLKYVYILLLSSIITMHKKPLKLLVQIKVFSLQREQLANMINSVSVVPVKIFGYAEIDHNDIDGIITDWIPRQQYQNIPLFNLSSICGQWNFCELERFLRELSDGKF